MLDSGLQAERTRLAWSRTALAFGAVGALMLHAGLDTGRPMDALPGVIAICSAAATYLLGVGRYHATNRRITRKMAVASAGSVRTLTALTAMTVVLALVQMAGR